MDSSLSLQHHKNMQNIKSKNTILRKALWHNGIRYRKNFLKLSGKPDIVLTKYKIAIFCDGDFWHCKNKNKTFSRIKTNRQYWLPKLKRNIERDKEIDDLLTEQGWLVLRFWESDIKKDLHKCVNKVLEYLS